MRPNLNINSKKKIINDPVYGFISLYKDIHFDLIEHPYYQRLRRIKQLGLSCYVYPGAMHTRFSHAIGASFLMKKAINVLRYKGVEITLEEEIGVLIAILLHDIGHGPFSHTLEFDLVQNVSHEELSLLFMQRLSKEFDGRLDLAIEIFENRYPKFFLHQLVSSQLDVDRMDYLNRDSYYTGVTEGIVGSERLIEMLNVANNELVVEEKGIYSIEKFLVSRRLMYWQVYMHKTVVSSEVMLIKILRRAKELVKAGEILFASPSFLLFLKNDYQLDDFKTEESLLNHFAMLDDDDIMGAIKVWQNHPDKVLSLLCTWIINRKLFKNEITPLPFSEERINYELEKVKNHFQLTGQEAHYFVHTDSLKNNAYNEHKENINLLMKDGTIQEVSKAADNLNIHALSAPVQKHFLCYTYIKN